MMREADATLLWAVITLLIMLSISIIVLVTCMDCSDEPPRPRDTAAAELHLARLDATALAAQLADAVQARAAAAALEAEAAVLSSEPAPLPVQQLPYFPYAAARGRASETLCAICLEPLLPRQLCSEVPACRHAFHRDCLAMWVKSKVSCPLCRAEIVPGLGEVAVADDMV